MTYDMNLSPFYCFQVNARCNYLATPLIWAATSDNADAVSILCEAGVNPKLKARPPKVADGKKMERPDGKLPKIGEKTPKWMVYNGKPYWN